MSAPLPKPVAPPIPAEEVCALIGAEVPAALRGRMIEGVATLQEATGRHASFIQREKFRAAAENSLAAMLIVPQSLVFDAPNVVKVRDVMEAVIRIMDHFYAAPARSSFVHPTAVVASGAHIGAEVFIGPHVVVEEGARIGAGTRIEAHGFIGARAELGEGCRLHPRVTVLEDTQVGSRVILHSGVVLGSDGFRYEFAGGRLMKVPQVGRVVVGDDVEIGANSAVDRAFLNETRIGARTKIDNMVHIGHNVDVGADCILVAQVGIAGSARIGRGTIIGGQSAIKDHVTIGSGVKIGGRSAITSDLPDGAEVIGSPPVSLSDFARFAYFVKNFPAIWRRLKPLLDDKTKR